MIKFKKGNVKFWYSYLEVINLLSDVQEELGNSEEVERVIENKKKWILERGST